MNNSKCVHCFGAEIPKCLIYKIINAVSLDDLIQNKNIKRTPFLVCHQNARTYDNGIIETKESCDHCNLCKIICNSEAEECVNDRLIISDIYKFNICFSSLFEMCTIASEVKVCGNCREKRIDEVIIVDKKIYLIKLLTDIRKYPFYERSYNEVLNNYKNNYSEFKFYFVAIAADAEKENINKLKYNIMTIKDFNLVLRGDL